jgi:tetratricopeptide (TPR) repeat protein
MMGKFRNVTSIFLLAGCVAASGSVAYAQAGQSQPPQQPTTQNKDQKPADTGSSLDIPKAQSPSTPEEDAAFKAYQAMPTADPAKKITAGEDFLTKYPESRYRSIMYSSLVFAYIQTGNSQKAQEIGEKEVALKPDDVQTMAILSQTMTRSISSSTPEPAKVLAKAQDYAKRAIEVTPTIPKPDGMTDENFLVAKNQTLAMAHGGLGLAYFRLGKLDAAIPELEQSVKIDPNPTPDVVNFYLLGMANQKASHFDAAAAAYTKCASIASSVQDKCKAGVEESKKLGATQLSAPK